MPFHVRGWVGIVVFGLLSVQSALGQQRTAPPDSAKKWHEDAWTDIVRQKGVRISYIYYPEADNEHDGIVLRLDNDTDGAVRYAFTIIFRAPKAETTATVQGTLRPGQMKTGEDAGLFWIPFRNEDRNIGEVGLRNIEITPAEDEPSAHSKSSPPERSEAKRRKTGGQDVDDDSPTGRRTSRATPRWSVPGRGGRRTPRRSRPR